MKGEQSGCQLPEEGGGAFFPVTQGKKREYADVVSHGGERTGFKEFLSNYSLK